MTSLRGRIYYTVSSPTYIVEKQTLEGHGDHPQRARAGDGGLRQGRGLLGTAADPIVRVDARRLRDKLREYYVSAPHDPVLISVPKGSYAPVFETNGHAAPAAVDAIRPAPTFTSRVWSVRGAMVLLGVCASLALAIGWRSVAAKPSSLRILTVTAFPGAEGMPSLSPDGNFVVFTWRGIDSTEANDLWVKAVDGDELKRLTNTPQFHEAMPAWSPDGRQIAYYRLEGIQNGGVFLVSPLGGPERKIADLGGSPAWTPDGQSLVMTGATADGQGIFQQALETGARKRLTQSPAGFTDDFPKVSPDGKTVAFTRGKSPQSALFVVSITGGEPTRLTQWGGEIGRLDWTPDGREILYPQLDTSGMRIFRISAAAEATPAAVAGLPIGINGLSVSQPRAGRTVPGGARVWATRHRTSTDRSPVGGANATVRHGHAVLRLDSRRHARALLERWPPSGVRVRPQWRCANLGSRA